jgi:hypothetical protein
MHLINPLGRKSKSTRQCNEHGDAMLGHGCFENGNKYVMGWVLAAQDIPVDAYSHPDQKDGCRRLISGNPTYKVNRIILSNDGDFVQTTAKVVQNQIQELFESAL